MERQAIERLAMDLALGELNEEAAALFEAYLAEHPEAGQWAQPMKAICLRTQDAIHTKTQQLTTPAHRSTALRRVPIGWARLGRWAAVVTIALALGAVADRWLKHDVPAPRLTVAVESTRNPLREDWRRVLNEPGQSFWESKAAAALGSKPERSHAQPASQPNLLEMFKQRQKERNHA
jgi:hypothetical protein